LSENNCYYIKFGNFSFDKVKDAENLSSSIKSLGLIAQVDNTDSSVIVRVGPFRNDDEARFYKYRIESTGSYVNLKIVKGKSENKYTKFVYYVTVGSFGYSDLAEEALNATKEAGFFAFISEGGLEFHVQFGPFLEKSNAEFYMKEYNSKISNSVAKITTIKYSPEKVACAR